MVLGTTFPKGALCIKEISLLLPVECRRSKCSFIGARSSGSSLALTDGDPIDETEDCRLEEGLVESLIASCSSMVSGKLKRLPSPDIAEDSFSGPEFLLPGIVVGHEHPNSFREQPPQIGRTSSHFFFRRLQVQHPVRTRTMRVVLGCRSGGILVFLLG